MDSMPPDDCFSTPFFLRQALTVAPQLSLNGAGGIRFVRRRSYL